MNEEQFIQETSEEGMELQLWEYIDGTLSSDKRSLIDQLIAENAAWRAKYHELLEVHQLIGETELEQPSLRFTKNVMDEIAKLQIAPAAKEYINKKVIWGIAFFFITIIVSFLVYGISQINWAQSSSETIGGVDLTKVDYSKMFNNTYMNIFMMMNVVLGLMLLDRYLNDRKKKLFKNA